MREGKSAAARRAIADGVHDALVKTMEVPEADRFHVITEHDPGGMTYDPDYLGVHRTDGVIFVQIFLKRGRTPEMKRAMYRNIVANLRRDPGLRSEDVLIVLTENDAVDWSFGNGVAHYAA
jgi:phenylpyruvate tautomerase PptA (4-oxalocrotonate tautomerase family)